MDYSMKDLKNAASLIQKSVFGKKSEYQLKFNHESDGCWYVDFPGWPFDHHNLMIKGHRRIHEENLDLSCHPLCTRELSRLYLLEENSLS